MDGDIFTDLGVINVTKTYKVKRPQARDFPGDDKDLIEDEIPRPLTTKVAVKYLLEGRLKSKVCRYCLNITAGLSELDQVMKIAGTGNIYKVTIRDIVASFHPFKVVEDPNFPNKICQKCLDRALSAYLFTQQCERSERAMLNCFDDMYEKLEKLDPLDRPKKRGRQKLNPNYNILHAEHDKVIDYAEPIINIVNVGAETTTNEPELNDLECKKCWQVLPNMESLLNHEKIHPKTMWYHCRLCGKSFPKCNQLKKHNNRVHILGKEPNLQIDKDFKCKECDHVTENFIQHLQHMEKHKFKSLMEHLIERKMDNLCVICFNKGSSLNDLDKLVCIHGGHPDLMGDKSLYHLLASTLPNPKSYKYQELYVPSQAQIMTISKKPYTEGETSFKRINSSTLGDAEKDHFVFSNPVVVTKNRFKSDHFYFYVFCDPDNHINAEIKRDFDFNANQIEKQYLPNVTKLVEIVEIDEINDEINAKKSKICPNYKNTIKYKKSMAKRYEEIDTVTQSVIITEDITKKFETNDILFNEKTKFDDVKENIIKKQASMKENPYTFTNPNLVHKEYKMKDESLKIEIPHATLRLLGYEFQKPEYKTGVVKEINGTQHIHPILKSVSKDNERCNSEEVMKSQDKRLMKDKCDKGWVFKNTSEMYKSGDNINICTESKKDAKCEYCWVFKHVNKCYNCEKPNIKENKPKNVVTNKEYNRIKDYKANINNEIWQCSICLTNNYPDRITCQCCGTVKTTEYSDMKITFGNNTTFFQLKEKDRYEITEIIDEKYDSSTVDTVEEEESNNTVIDEPTLMDYKNNTDDSTETENAKIQTMEVETNTHNIKDVEEMEVEENPITLNKGAEWTESPFNLNIDNFSGTVNNARPSVGATLQFNIGCIPAQKQPPKKFKKALRHIPKAFHK